MYAILRKDLNMRPGKAISQAAHAFLMTYLKADLERQQEYHKDGIGTKICLKVKSLDELIKLHEKAKASGVPNFLVVDSGNNTSFKGETTTSALGIGPLYAEETEFVEHLSLY